MNDIICRTVELPSSVNAVTVIDDEGDFNIYVNTCLSSEAQKRAFDHEARHIKKNHFFSSKDVISCENEAKNN